MEKFHLRTFNYNGEIYLNEIDLIAALLEIRELKTTLKEKELIQSLINILLDAKTESGKTNE